MAGENGGILLSGMLREARKCRQSLSPHSRPALFGRSWLGGDVLHLSRLDQDQEAAGQDRARARGQEEGRGQVLGWRVQ